MPVDIEEKQTEEVLQNQNSSIVTSSQKDSSSGNKRHNKSSHLTKEEIRHQRFIKDLKKDIQVCLKQCIRESRFDSSINQSSSKRRTRTIDRTNSHRRLKTDSIVVSTMKNRQRSMEHFKRGELKRLTADVENILTGSEMKHFYTKFIQRPIHQQQQASPRIHISLLEESLLRANEQK
ncbi:hypothetical protein I4U23_014366 [Adineta vaga]|nr:hypothetical protein I4U23_014366 [Adineta vaga]